MKRCEILLIGMGALMILACTVIGCKSTPKPAYVAPPVNIATYKSVYLEVAYDPVLLVTVEDKKRLIANFSEYLTQAGFLVTMKPERADMIMKVSIDELILSDRNERLAKRITFGLKKGESLIVYSALFTDARTFQEITKTEGSAKAKGYFPSEQDIKDKFLTIMEQDIMEFMSSSSMF
ncbi:MAG: hypothetical protein JW885_02125 [Deltaproteobacteria bacterium]|nr:hypothetical protein [Candidatus Zymogenaceae bacterium]